MRRIVVVIGTVSLVAVAASVVLPWYHMFRVSRLLDATVKWEMDRYHDIFWRKGPIDELVSLGPEALPVLTRLMKQEKPFPWNGKVADDESSMRRATMWVALGRIGSPQLVPALVTKVERAEDLGPLVALTEYPYKTQTIVDCLSQAAERAAKEIPTAHEVYDRKVIRAWTGLRAALNGLASAIGEPGVSRLARKELERLAYHPTPDVRFRSLSAWSEAGDVNVIPALIKAKSDSDEMVSGHADHLLESLTGRPGGLSVQDWEAWWSQNRDKIAVVDTGSILGVKYKFVVKEKR